MTWPLLLAAIAVEVAASLLIKAAGQGNVPAIIAVVSGYATSFAIVSQVVQRLEIGTVYAIWSGAGTALVAIIGIAALGESLDAPKVFGLILIISGVGLLNLAGA